MKTIALFATLLFSVSSFALSYECELDVGDPGGRPVTKQLVAIEQDEFFDVREAQVGKYFSSVVIQLYKIPRGVIGTLRLKIWTEDGLEMSATTDIRQLEDVTTLANDPTLLYSTEDGYLILSCKTV
jgi:hypothetical protein